MRSLSILLVTALGATALILPSTTASADEPSSTSTARDLVPAGYDLFETDPQATEFNFGAMPLPPDFFAPGSDPFNGVVKLCGDQLGTFNGQDVGDTDTVVRRSGAMDLSGPGSSATVPIEIVSLNLVSCEPITVTFDGGPTQSWDIKIDLSPTQPSRGQLNVTQTGENGGTFTSELTVIPRLTFTRPNGSTRTKDLGTFPGLFSGLRTQLSDGQWNRRCGLPALQVPGVNDVFCPGLTPGGKKILNRWQGSLIKLGLYPAQPRLEHFVCYSAKERGTRFRPRKVRITDQFGAQRVRVVRPRELCNPAQKNSEQFLQNKVHLKCYQITTPRFNGRTVVTRNQFGSLTLTVKAPRNLCVTTLKKLLKGSRPTISGQPNQRLVDNFVCYSVANNGSFAARQVRIRDQFGRATVNVIRPVELCTPASVNQRLANHLVGHLVCYVVTPTRNRPRRVQTSNAFGREVLHITKRNKLCVPSNKVLA